MPPKPNNAATTNTNANANATATASKPKPSLNSVYKSYGGWPNFMHSHGLKTWDMDDVDEGHRIAEAMLEHDRLDEEEGK
ncbi:hypothetical protein EUX98_g945 [Antrodiella citrinella]|uniref:Uncharacterized protein n=1 Tax=Antrodiella citrinella TaxID=2447956 RepID=A0A4S4NB73_9APHY|nr:hypothetical protein EUX98_g945 [Antrodiella citrinella]